MRALWKGAITFGLVNVPIRLYAATEDHDIGLHQVHDADGGRIRYQRRCEVCGKAVEYSHIDKAYAEGKTTVVLTEDDLKSLPEERSKEIEVVEFVPSEQIDPIMFGRSYFLEPDRPAVKAYTLLRRALEETDRTAIVQFSLRQKTRLAALRSRGNLLMLQSLLWDDEVREADFASLKEDVRVSSQELKMASSLVDNMAADFIDEVVRTKIFDSVVLDMPASGEALRYLYFPKLVGSIGRKFTGMFGMFSGVARMFQPLSKIPTPSRNVLQSEVELLDRLEALSEIIRMHDITSLRLVANPDTFSIENAKRAFVSASLYGINVDLAVINKIMPSGSSDQYYASWSDFQRSKLEEAKANFYPLPIKEIKLHGSELRGVEMLQMNGELMFGNEDPAKIFYRGKAFVFTTEDSELHMIVKVPFTEKDDFDIERYGDQLTIKVKNPVGNLVNVIPLPSATIGMKLVKAKLQGDELDILFKKGV